MRNEHDLRTPHGGNDRRVPIRARRPWSWTCLCLGLVLAACDASAAVESTDAEPGATTAETGTTAASVGVERFLATLISTGCAANWPGPIEAGGMTTFEVRNHTSSLASFQLLRLHGSYDEFTRAFADIQQRNAAGEDLDVDAELADVIEPGQRIQVEVSESGEIVTEATPGDYAMWCISLDEHEDIVTAWTAGPFTVIDG
jgi:hypothetical protein